MTAVTMRRRKPGVLLEWARDGVPPHRWQGFLTAAAARAAYPDYEWRPPPAGAPRAILAVAWIDPEKEDA